MQDLARIVVCVDDTDDVTKETSTGAVAESIARRVAELGGVLELDVTRHQLLLDERVPYTSHNSSMALTARMPAERLDDLRSASREVVRSMMADASDPGLCIANVPEAEDDPCLFELVSFGRRAKQDYIAKAEALELAARIEWLTLEELGGDGQGVVGALAGVGLRLSGSDGRFRGKWDLKAVCEGATDVTGNKSGRAGMGVARGDGSGGGSGRGDGSGGGRGNGQGRGRAGGPGGISPAGEQREPAYPVGRVKEALEARLAGRVLVVGMDGVPLPDSTLVSADEEVKPLLHAGCFTIVANLDAEGVAHPCRKTDFDDARSGFDDMNRSCPAFEFDNDLEEYGCTEAVAACPNCLYRRWVSSGFTCMKRMEPARPFSEVVM